MKKKHKKKKEEPKGPPWYWGDERADWEGIENAAEFIGQWLRDKARMGIVQYKEKFGGVRVYGGFGIDCFHALVWPGYCWIHKWWPYKLDMFIFYKLGLGKIINKILVPIQMKLYRWRYQKAVDKWPHLKLEILIDADHQELLNGIHGYKTEDYWKSI